MIPEMRFELKGPEAVRQRMEEIRSRMSTKVPEPFVEALKTAEKGQPIPMQGKIGPDVEGEVPPFDPFAAARLSQLGPNPDKTQIQGMIAQVAREQNLDYNLLRSVVEAESSYNPLEVSHRGAKGLMQLMPDTARELGVTDAFNPYQNLTGGAKYLKKMLTRYQDNIDLALAAYNAGPGKVDRAQGIPNYAETKNYIAKIRANMASSGSNR